MFVGGELAPGGRHDVDSQGWVFDGLQRLGFEWAFLGMYDFWMKSLREVEASFWHV